MSQTTFVASASLIAIAVVASFAGTQFGLLSAVLFITRREKKIAEGNGSPGSTSDGLFLFVELSLWNGDRTGPDRRKPQGRADQKKASNLRAKARRASRMVTETSADAIVSIDDHSIINFAGHGGDEVFGSESNS